MTRRDHVAAERIASIATLFLCSLEQADEDLGERLLLGRRQVCRVE
jgi:hypothetical protein